MNGCAVACTFCTAFFSWLALPANCAAAMATGAKAVTVYETPKFSDSCPKQGLI
jgi:hypothetical protein